MTKLLLHGKVPVLLHSVFFAHTIPTGPIFMETGIDDNYSYSQIDPLPIWYLDSEKIAALQIALLHVLLILVSLNGKIR